MSTIDASPDSLNPLVNLLGPTLVDKEGETVDTSSLSKNKKIILLYFSAHWCPPCRAFTPVLSEAYAEYKEKVGDDIEAELVFVSSDRDAGSFAEYLGEMSFSAVPFDWSCRETLREKFDVGSIPSLVAIDPEGKLLHEDESLDAVIRLHGAAAFPLTQERFAELEDETEQKSKDALKKIVDGTLECPINAPNGKDVTLSQMLSDYDHIGLLIGDGDSDDPTYAEVERTIKALNRKKAGTFEVVYVGWSLRNPEHSMVASDHTPFAAKYYSLLDISEELRSTIKVIFGGPEISAVPSLLVFRRGAGVCTMDGICEPESVPIIVAYDYAVRRLMEGEKAYPWSDADMERHYDEEEARAEVLRSRFPNFSFLKGDEGEDLIIGKGGERVSVDALAALDDDAVVGFYFSADWFTPQLVKCYEELKAAGKKFEVVFVSSDKDKGAFEDTYSSMVTTKGDQWLALDYDQRELKRELSVMFYASNFNPSLVLLKVDGTILRMDAIEALQEHGAEYFPWDETMLEKAEADAIRTRDQVIRKEKESEEEQQVSGKIVVKRLRGVPGAVVHGLSNSTLKFDSFSTAGAPAHIAKSGVMYYEVELLSVGGIAQIGFSLADGMSVIDNSCNGGVGDDTKSWGFDGSRNFKWHDGENDGEANWPVAWSVGDVLGLAANIDDGKIAVSMNGNWEGAGCGVMFENEAIQSGVFPCISALGYELRYDFDGTKHSLPPAEMWSQVTKD